MQCACAGSLYICIMPCIVNKVRSFMIAIDYSDLDNDDMFEDPQSSMDAGGILHAIAEDFDKDDNCPTALRPKKSKGAHAGAAIYRCKYNAVWEREFPFIAPVPGDPYR